MKKYEKPVIEKLHSQIESHILAGSLNDEKGNASQLAKRQLDLFLDEDFSANKDNEQTY